MEAPANLRALSFSRDGRLLVGGRGGSEVAWDAARDASSGASAARRYRWLRGHRGRDTLRHGNQGRRSGSNRFENRAGAAAPRHHPERIAGLQRRWHPPRGGDRRPAGSGCSTRRPASRSATWATSTAFNGSRSAPIRAAGHRRPREDGAAAQPCGWQHAAPEPWLSSKASIGRVQRRRDAAGRRLGRHSRRGPTVCRVPAARALQPSRFLSIACSSLPTTSVADQRHQQRERRCGSGSPENPRNPEHRPSRLLFDRRSPDWKISGDRQPGRARPRVPDRADRGTAGDRRITGEGDRGGLQSRRPPGDVGGVDGVARVFERSGGREICRWGHENTAKARSASSPDGRFAAIGQRVWRRARDRDCKRPGSDPAGAQRCRAPGNLQP